uniref:Uncharacterized protein n=1 Tax=Globisporangium ultimum (strain ATCC 200006 / CBS 805.95 / DAOM BR144) TaxID=431595 RepID=K3WCV6_GLOUD
MSAQESSIPPKSPVAVRERKAFSFVKDNETNDEVTKTDLTPGTSTRQRIKSLASRFETRKEQSLDDLRFRTVRNFFTEEERSIRVRAEREKYNALAQQQQQDATATHEHKAKNESPTAVDAEGSHAKKYDHTFVQNTPVKNIARLFEAKADEANTESYSKQTSPQAEESTESHTQRSRATSNPVKSIMGIFEVKKEETSASPDEDHSQVQPSEVATPLKSEQTIVQATPVKNMVSMFEVKKEQTLDDLQFRTVRSFFTEQERSIRVAAERERYNALTEQQKQDAAAVEEKKSAKDEISNEGSATGEIEADEAAFGGSDETSTVVEDPVTLDEETVAKGSDISSITVHEDAASTVIVQDESSTETTTNVSVDGAVAIKSTEQNHARVDVNVAEEVLTITGASQVDVAITTTTTSTTVKTERKWEELTTNAVRVDTATTKVIFTTEPVEKNAATAEVASKTTPVSNNAVQDTPTVLVAVTETESSTTTTSDEDVVLEGFNEATQRLMTMKMLLAFQGFTGLDCSTEFEWHTADIESWSPAAAQPQQEER